jgi:lipopolysaccharide transport system ATP-binding protein
MLMSEKASLSVPHLADPPRIGSLLGVGTGFHPDLTGRENIFLNGTILGMKSREIRRNFDEIVAFAEVDRFLETAVKLYSSGMYLRLA